MTETIHVACEGQFQLAEGVQYDDATGHVWWTNINARELWRLDPSSGEERYWILPQRIGCFALTQRHDVILLALEGGLAQFNTATGTLKRMATVEPHILETRTNDGRCDRAGNLVFGTQNERGRNASGSWYRFDVHGRLQKLDLPQIAIPNSLCFSPDGGTVYWCDSRLHVLMQSSYDAATGHISNTRLFADPGNARVHPDGSCIDAEGCLWNAEWYGQRVVRYRPDGSVDRVISLPVSQPSCVAFGGPGLNILYISTAREDLDAAAIAQEPLAGSILAVPMGDVRGLPENRWLGVV